MLRTTPKSTLAGYLFLAILLLLVFPFGLEIYRLNLFAKYIAYGFVGIGLVLVWGYTGVLSLGQGVLFGLGGYMMAMFLKLEASGSELPEFMVWSSVDALPLWWSPFHNFYITLFGIIFIPGLLAFIFSYAFFRRKTSGVYIAIVTLSIALGFTVWLVGNQGTTGGFNGILDFETLLGWNITTDHALYVLYFVEVAAILLVLACVHFVIYSRVGLILLALKGDENRLKFHGYNTALMKAIIFTFGGIFASIGGAFYTLEVGLIAPSIVGVMASVEMVIYVAVGGRISPVGAVIGAIIVGFARTYFSESYPETWLYLLGALFIFTVMAMPDGIAGLLEKIIKSRRAVG